MVNGAGDEQYAGCTGFPADSHQVNWLTVRPTLESPHKHMIAQQLTRGLTGLPRAPS